MPLVVCGVPIGNLADASPRLAEVLAGADVVAAEDTRRATRLAAGLNIALAGRLVSYYDAVEAKRTPDLLAHLAEGRTVALISDAGMPAVSDPGYRLVSAAAAQGYPVSVVPGPSALTAALAVSGLPSDRVVFEGFLPRRPAERRRRLAELAGEPRTLVFLEAPHRIAASLADAVLSWGPQRPAVLCRELTKTYEEVLRGGLATLAELAAGRELRGEITVVVGGAPKTAAVVVPAELVAAVRRREATGVDRRSATAAVAKEAGVPRREVFDALVSAKEPGAGVREGSSTEKK